MSDHQQVIEKYIEEKKNAYNFLLEYIDQTDDDNNFSFVKNKLFKDPKKVNRQEIKEILEITKNIADNHHRTQNFMQKIKEILKTLQNEIKQFFSNEKLFEIFQNSKLILQFLIESGMIEFSKEIFEKIRNKFELNGNRFCHFFYPEIKKLLGSENVKDIEDELLLYDPNVFDNFEAKRKSCENESYICTLIREDLVVEFISNVNQTNTKLTIDIKPSIFETNSFLIENKPTLIEYSAFYGSIQIFQYLMRNDVKLTPSLWLYAIHSQNADLIHTLESNNVEKPNNDYLECYLECIKCHHNDIAAYIENFYDLNDEARKREEIISTVFKYHNYAYFPTKIESSDEFFYLFCNNYIKLVNEFIKMKEPEMISFVIQQ